MWKSKYTFSDSSLFGEESESQVYRDLLMMSLYELEKIYRSKTIEIVANKMFEYFLDEAKESLAEKFSRKFKDYIHSERARYNSKRRKELNLAWAQFRKRLAQEGQGAEYYKLRADYEDRKPRKEIMSLELYVKIFEGEKGEE